MLTLQDKEFLASKGITEEQVAAQLKFFVLFSFLTGRAVGVEPAPDGKRLNMIPKIRPLVNRMWNEKRRGGKQAPSLG